MNPRSIALPGALALVMMSTQLTLPVAHAANPSCDNFDSVAATGVLYCDASAAGTYTVTVTGAGGAGAGAASSGSSGGGGAVVSYTLSVMAGQTLTLEVGTGGSPGGSGGGASGRAAGGGGGWSAIKDGATLLVVAGGGGGGGTYNSFTSPFTGAPMNGGDAGLIGAGGVPSTTWVSGSDSFTGGGGGTQIAGGSGGAVSGTWAHAGVAGTAGSGGAGAFTCNPGQPPAAGGSGWVGGAGSYSESGCFASGGGGAGYYGGGGGGANETLAAAGGGGGGSSYPADALVTVAANGGVYRTAGGAGRIVFSALTPPSPPSPSGGGGTPVTQVTISFGLNGGSGAVPAIVGPATSWITAPDGQGLSRPEYRFIGWNTAADGLGLAFAPGAALRLTGDNTLFAQWALIDTADMGEGSGSETLNSSTPAAQPSDPSRPADRTCRERAKVYFASMSAALSSDSKATLAALVKATGKNGIRSEVVGYVQPVGSTRNDDSLSLARARNVERYLKSLGLRGTYDISGDGRAQEQGAKARRVNVAVTAVCPK